MTDNNVRAVRRGSALFVTLGWISAILSVFFYPFVLGVLGVIMGILASKNGSRAGVSVIVASILLMGIGLIFNATIRLYTGRFLGIF